MIRIARDYLESGAFISHDGRYRYSLWRRMEAGNRVVMFVGLNPSTADASADDPTIRRCVGFARRLGFDMLLMTNLHAYRCTQPAQLLKQADPVGPDNDATVRGLALNAHRIVAAWGSNPLAPAARTLATWICGCSQTVCLGQNRDGSPKHPLYLAANTQLRWMEKLA